MAIQLSTAALVVVVCGSALAGAVFVWILVKMIQGDTQVAQIPIPAAPVTADESAVTDSPQILLWVSRAKGDKPGVMLRGQRVSRLDDVSDPGRRAEAVEALQAILAFADGWLPTARQPGDEAPRLPAADRRPLGGLLQPERPVNPRRPEAQPLPQPLVLAKEIDELLQERLRERPELFKLRVRLTTAVDGTLRIHVGDDIFDSVSAISTPDVRALVQESIEAWEIGAANPT